MVERKIVLTEDTRNRLRRRHQANINRLLNILSFAPEVRKGKNARVTRRVKAEKRTIRVFRLNF